MLKLVIEDDEGKTTVVPLIRDEITIGRKEGNTIRLTERNISRRHARLVKDNGAVFVEDLGSYNGIKLNGVKIGALTPVGEGDTVGIGDYRLSVRSDRPPATASPAATTTPAMPRATVLGVAPIGAPTAAAAPATDAPPPAAAPIPTAPPAAPVAPQVPAPFPAAPSVANPGLPSPALNATRLGMAASMGDTPTPPPVALPTPAVPVPPTPFAAPFAPPAPFTSPTSTLEAAPTVPVRTFMESAPPFVPASAAAGGRLVVLSTDLAGSEFGLDRPSLVLGRTEENDVVLNHKSISRHHAKVVRENDRYTIVDLQSANGVRVNGEEYERVELHPGDRIELGHVKLLFLGPGEAFDPSLIVTAPRFPAKKIVLMIGAAGVAFALVALLLKNQGPKPTSKLVEPVAQTPPAPPATTTAPASPVATEAPAPPAEPVADVIAKAEAAARDEQWADAIAALDTVLKREPEEARAKELRRTYEAEKGNAESYARFKQAAEDGNYDDAVVAYTEITEKSAYVDKGAGLFKEVRGKFIARHLETAEKLRAQGKCTEVQAEARMVFTVDEKNKDAKDVVRMCKPRSEPVAVVAATPAPRKEKEKEKERTPRKEKAPEPSPAKTLASSGTKPPDAKPAEGGGDPMALVKVAREAWVRGQHAAAIDAARKALKIKPGLTEAYLIMAVASCSLRDGDGAGRAYAKLDDKMKGMVRSSCGKNGINLE